MRIIEIMILRILFNLGYIIVHLYQHIGKVIVGHLLNVSLKMDGLSRYKLPVAYASLWN